MNEARGIWFSHYYDENNQEHSFTLRQDDEDDGAFVDRVVNFQQTLTSKGFFPKTRPAASPNVAHVAAQQLGGTVSPFFEVESIALASGGEHPRWVVKGGNFTKFGVTAWPEVLEQAGLLEHLDPLKDNTPQTKWIAHYIEKTNDAGKQVPDKITRLERVKE